MAHPMLQESWDEAMSCAQIEHDQEQHRLEQSKKGLSAPVKTDTTTLEMENQNGIHRI
mgnify:CR=1 FL=1